MFNPFDPLITVAEFQALIGDTSTDETKIKQFLFTVYKMLVSYGLPTPLNGVPRNIQEESLIATQGGYSGDYSYNGSNSLTYIPLNNPILTLTSVKLKNQTQNPPTFSPDVAIGSFQFMQYQKFIETGYCNFNSYSALFWPMQTYAKYVQVNYTTGIPNNAQTKEDLLQAMFLIFLDIGLDFEPDVKLNAGRLTRFKADDREETWDYSNSINTKDYITSNTNPHLVDLLSKYIGIKKNIF